MFGREPGLLLVAIMLASGFVTTGCLTQNCTEVGCQSGISVKLVGEPKGENKRVHACLEADCIEMAWPNSACDSTWSPPLDLSVCIQDDGVFITLSVTSEVTLKDGMHFELRIEDGSGKVVFDESESVEFSDSYPNGKQCPGHCKYANFRY